MRRHLLVPIAIVALTFATSTVALAEPDGVQPGGVSDPSLLALITDDDVFSEADLTLLFASAAPLSMGGGNGTQHYGPYASGSADSGTCGNDWADDTFDRHFTVRQTGPMTYEVVEQFKKGAFVTMAGTNLSPGACQTDDGSSTTVVAGGITGTMHGYLSFIVNGTQTSMSPDCAPAMTPCNGGTFVQSHFTGATITQLPTFFFHYAGKDGSNQVLIEHEWKNASCDRGGNHGDIATAGAIMTPTQFAVCP